jgi:ribosomal protein S18 acetylase RimI-like enzyme
MPTADVRIEHYSVTEAQRVLVNVMEPLYAASYADVASDPFYSIERFLERKTACLRNPGCVLVVAYDGNEAVGLAFGFPLLADTQWWERMETSVPDEFKRENGTRTFAVNELMVSPRWQRQHVGKRLHDQLLRGRCEERATLVVRGDNVPAWVAYTRWGWTKVGTLRPSLDSPRFDAMMIRLPLGERHATTESPPGIPEQSSG